MFKAEMADFWQWDMRSTPNNVRYWGNSGRRGNKTKWPLNCTLQNNESLVPSLKPRGQAIFVPERLWQNDQRSCGSPSLR